MASALTMTPPSSSASAMASADLPLAVGPAISTVRFSEGMASMDSVVILIAAPGARAISSAMVTGLHDLAGSAPQWLSKGEVLEVLTAAPSPELRAELDLLVKDCPIDVAVVPVLHRSKRRKRLLIADMDSTIIGQECI